MRTVLTSAIPLSTGDQEQQDCSALGCAGCQPDLGSAAPGTAPGRPAGLCQHEGRGLRWNVRLGEVWQRQAAGCWGSCGCGCGGDDV